MYVFLSVCLLQVRFVYPCVTSYHFYAPTKATRILGKTHDIPYSNDFSNINALVLTLSHNNRLLLYGKYCQMALVGSGI